MACAPDYLDTRNERSLYGQYTDISDIISPIHIVSMSRCLDTTTSSSAIQEGLVLQEAHTEWIFLVAA